MAHDLSDPLPESKQNNLWFHYNDSESVIVFLHGIFSDSQGCWLCKDKTNPARSIYWPALIKSDARLSDPSIYLAGFYTAFDAGPYEVRNCADEVFRALDREDAEGRPGPLSKPSIVFICHSTGGIVARYLLEENESRFVAKKIGLVLIASPSYGSKLSDRLGWLAQLYNQRLGEQLQWGNWSLRDLDARFKNLVNQHRLPGLRGIEAYENHFVFHRRLLPSKTLVVTEESAGRYFGAPVLLRNTNHFSCVKPDSLHHPAHELLVDFWTKEMAKPLLHPNVILNSFEPEYLKNRLEHTRRLRMLVMRSSHWFATNREWLMQRMRDGKLEMEILLPEPANDNLMTELRSMYDNLTPSALAESIRAVIARLLLMRAALPADLKDKLRIATHEYYPPYSAYLFDDDELWYIPYHRKAGQLPVFVYSKPLKNIAVYEDFRTLPAWSLTDDAWRRRLAKHVQSRFNNLIDGCSLLNTWLKQSQKSGGKVLVFGGFVRDSIHSFVHSQHPDPRDLDLVVDGIADIRSNAVQNHFGGRRWETDGGLRVDCWDLASTYAFCHDLISPATVENLPRTTVYRLNGCCLDLGSGMLYGEEAIADIFARRVAFNCKDYLYEFPQYQAFRAIDLAERLCYELDDEVKEFISQTLRTAGAQLFEHQVREHRPDLDASFLRTYFDRYV
jgi:hypothetical protein